MRIELATSAGLPERPNEDWASVALPASGQGGSLVALDGVTPPRGDDGCVHGVPWFTARLGGALLELTTSRHDLQLTGILSTAIRRTADAHRQTCDLSHVRTPQATVVLARWGGPAGDLEYLVLSDSTLLLESPAGEVRAVLDDRLDRLPREALRTHASADVLRNAEGGFFTAAADPSVAARAVTGRVPRAGVRSLTALTDGASRWTDLFKEGDWTDCVALLRASGPQALIDRVRAVETTTREETTGPIRWKLHDDATAIFVEP
ncbi:hypothetical protein [Streptomyces qinzhouensis]|uniref:Protein phosphatase 2C domain-containing protein n=1 Tax=Streptomyces qinzhouensis TaxID=2599401 RepID=A0A5B8JC77_9ACTN|nr:hypothetical protein [Streptomyces qinzhouensis]QDY78996.1 hypothetical protein FQU76_23530 [Streptomyces qinzhouensis]